jgi:trans-aconitate methyltransferase
MTAKPRASADAPVDGLAGHWDGLYRTRNSDDFSWTQAEPVVSLRLIDQLPIGPEDGVIDIGAGESTLVDALLARRHRDLTVLDAAPHALERAHARLIAAGQHAGAATVSWEIADVLTWRPARTYRLWHDRAVFHFLTDPADRTTYRTRAIAAVEPGGFLVVGTFAADGPTHCSGLPVRRYSPAELAAEFAPDFVSRIADDEHHHTPWGAVQHFTWLVLQRQP